MRSLRGKLVAFNFSIHAVSNAGGLSEACGDVRTVQRRFVAAMGRDLVLSRSRSTPSGTRPRCSPLMLNSGVPKRMGGDFLTGPPEAVRKAATDWGLVYWPEDGAITHTSRTALIGRDGRLLAIVEGSSYRTDQLIELIAVIWR